MPTGRSVPPLAAAALLITLAAPPAHASAGMSCSSLDETPVSIEVNLPRLSFWAVPNNVTVEAGDAKWSTYEVEGFRPAALAQAFNDERVFAIDLSDDQATELVATIRLLQAEAEDGLIFYGYLRVPGQPVHPITCGFTE